MVFCGVDVQLSIACATDERPGVIDETPISVDHLDSAFHRAICDHVPMRPVAEAIASDTRGSAQDTVLAQRVRSIRHQLKATERSEDNRHAIYYRKWTDTWTRVFALPVPEHLRKPPRCRPLRSDFS